MDLAGIVLIGGKSKRMGCPKALIHYKGEKLYQKTAALLENFTDQVFISGTNEQKVAWNIEDYPFIEDNYHDIGPISGILSSLENEQTSQKALIIVATDMPLLDYELIQKLTKKRKTNKFATLFQHADSGFLEPLCAIYESSSKALIKQAVTNGQYALHRIFKKEDLELIDLQRKRAITNINYPKDLKDLENN